MLWHGIGETQRKWQQFLVCIHGVCSYLNPCPHITKHGQAASEAANSGRGTPSSTISIGTFIAMTAVWFCLEFYTWNFLQCQKWHASIIKCIDWNKNDWHQMLVRCGNLRNFMWQLHGSRFLQRWHGWGMTGWWECIAKKPLIQSLVAWVHLLNRSPAGCQERAPGSNSHLASQENVLLRDNSCNFAHVRKHFQCSKDINI